MDISLETIQNLAPDQASLNAAKKLIKPAKWPLLGQDSTVHTIWGQCQGSGANPYLTMADVVDHGYKCTCPSRKFPCKHVLALLWQFADRPGDFQPAEPPAWVQDWLGRRRKSGKKQEESGKKTTAKNIQAARETESSPAARSPEEQAAQEVAQAKRAATQKAATDHRIRDALAEFQQWVDDQLRTGIEGLLKEVHDRCRQIAARMVDGKATNLASRLDELPAKILLLSPPQQPHKILQELGQLIWLSEAWLADPDDPDARRSVATAESREVVLDDPGRMACSGRWEVVGEQIATRRDGLISHASWLLNLDAQAEQRFAVLQDYYPAATGRRQVGGRIGSVLAATLVFYPSRLPLRALIEQQEILPATGQEWPQPLLPLETGFARALGTIPWLEQYPFVLAGGRVVADQQGQWYWQDDNSLLPLRNSQLSPLLTGSSLRRACVTWDGEGVELLSAQAEQWGTLRC